jgi:hypothetical protein
MSWLWNFCRFWYDFIVGDDWTIAVGVLAGVAATTAAAHVGLAAWIVLPLVVTAMLAWSISRVRPTMAAGNTTPEPSPQ